jgi:hypothetical protein
MDGWFLGDEDRPKSASTLQEAPNPPQIRRPGKP